MRYAKQHRLMHLGSMARIKVDLWGRFLPPCINFYFEKLTFLRWEEGRVKLDNASWMAFTKVACGGRVGTVVVTYFLRCRL